MTLQSFGSLQPANKIITAGTLKQFNTEIDHVIRKTRSSANIEYNAAAYEVVFNISELFCEHFGIVYEPCKPDESDDSHVTKYGHTTNIKSRLLSMFRSIKTRKTIKYVRLFPMRTSSFGARFVEQKLIQTSTHARKSQQDVYVYNSLFGYNLPTTECFTTEEIDHNKVNLVLDNYCLDPILIPFSA